MKELNLNRRLFLQRAAVAAGALSVSHFIPGPNILTAADAGKKLNCAVIGCGGRGMTHLESCLKENLVAIVDPDESKHAKVQKWLQDKKKIAGKFEAFTDYRTMFDKMAKHIDAVFIAAPNHHHAPASLIAMQLGKAVYCEKPVCHDVAEARKLRETAAKYKVATQMGNQGHCQEGYRRLCEFIWAGVVGKITETHSWTNRANGGKGPRPAKSNPPAGMSWDAWIGPAPYRDFHGDLHPHEWHGWYDFGNGGLGNLGCHALDGVFWALKLEHPTSFEVEEMWNGTAERLPTGSRVRWDFPARGDMPPLKAYWYDGRIGNGDPGDGPKEYHEGTKGAKNLPPLLLEMQKKYPDEEFDSSGTLYVGEKGILYTGTYGGRMHILPIEKMKEIKEPPKTLPRPRDCFKDFIEAVRAGSTDTATSFDYGTRLTEFTLLGNLAHHAGLGKKVLWDGPNMKVTNLPELNKFVKTEYRKGWQVG